MDWMFTGSWLLDAAALCFLVLLPLVVGLPPLLFIMESVFVMTGREIWKQMTRFWGELFGVTVQGATLGTAALAIACAIAGGPLGNAIAVVCAIAFVTFLAQLLLYRWCFREWWQMSRVRHLAGSLVMMVLPNLAVLAVAALAGLAGNAGDDAGLESSAAHVLSLLASPAVQERFVHLACACCLAAAGLLLAIGAWYLLRGRNVQIARRSMTVAASFGLASALALAVQSAVMVPGLSATAPAATACLRAMMIVGTYLIVLFAWAFHLASSRRLQRNSFLRLAAWSVSLPWIAMALGWLVFSARPEVVAADTSRSALAALLGGLAIAATAAFTALRIRRLVQGGPELLNLWPADADTTARY